MSSDEVVDECVPILWQWLLLNANYRQFWVHPYNRKRNPDNTVVSLIRELQNYPDKFRNYTRMSQESFDFILNLIKNTIQKTDTNFRKCITPEEKLFVTLRFLATGETFVSLHYQYRLGETTISKIVYETCQALWDHLSPIYMKTPDAEKFIEIANGFEQLWNFPNCVGALDGKHIRIQCPPKAGSSYFNYKKYHSISLQAVADSEAKFLFIDVGDFGRNNDASVFKHSNFGRMFVNQTLDLPPHRELPFVFVADEAYPLRINLMKPFSKKNLTPSKRIFNYRLSRARRIIECAFGMLSKKFAFIKTEIIASPKKVTLFTMTACVLHNMIREREETIKDVHAALEEFMEEETPIECSVFRPTTTALHVRHNYMEYFNSNRGSVSWQDKYANL